MTEKDKKKLRDGIVKKAVGYEAVETQEEYALQDGEMQLVKRKVTVRDVPPDLAALKLLLGEDESEEDVRREDIEAEREALTKAFFARLERRQRTPNR